MDADPQQIEQLKELMRQNIALAEENNKILHGMRRSAWIGQGIRVLWVVLILVASYYSYLYVQPYLTQIEGFYGNLQGLQQKASQVLSSFNNSSATTTQQH